MNSIKSGKGKTFFANASVLKRIIAFVIDLLIINLIILFPFRGIFNKIVPDASFSKTFDFLNSNSEASTSITVLMVAVAVLTILYFVILENKLRQSIGKMIFNLYVEGQDKDIKYWQLFARSMFLIPIFPFVLLWIIDPIVMLFTKENQRLSEILSKTKVVERYSLR
jgi:hypothetical protein|tara:strand:- start:1451 stop:1951 length:501 start_codon:yes stop_codon:yes gene_type:complete